MGTLNQDPNNKKPEAINNKDSVKKNIGTFPYNPAKKEVSENIKKTPGEVSTDIEVNTVETINGNNDDIKNIKDRKKELNLDVKTEKVKNIELKKEVNVSKIEGKSTKELNKKKVEGSRNIRKPETSSKLLWILFIIGILLFITFYIVLLWGLLSGDVSNPMFTQLGIKSDGLRSLLLTLTNFVFGGFALTFLISFLVAIFKWFLMGKNAYNRPTYLRKFGTYLILFFVVIGIWIFFYLLIMKVNVKKVDVRVESLIKTMPNNVIGLTSPIQIEFDVAEKLYKKISKESIRQIDWDFEGDGIVDSSGPRVVHRFLDKGLNGGRYPVKAIIYYFSEKDQKEHKLETTREVRISNEKIIGRLTASPDGGASPFETELSVAESVDPDGEIILYEWDLDDDGEFEIRGQNKDIVKKTFEQSGEYKVKARLTGSNKDFIIIEKIIKVHTPEGSLRAEITADKPFEGYPPFKLMVDGSHSFVREGKITRYEWLVTGDKEPFLGRKRQLIFRKPGDYKLSLIVQNDLGERHKVVKIIHILKEDDNGGVKIKTTPQVVSKSGILIGKVPFKVVFDASKSEVKNALEWHWDFENDGISDGFTSAVEHVFRKPGFYDVKLTIIDADEKRHELIQKIEVSRAGIAARIKTNPVAGAVPLKVDFDGSGSSSDEGIIVDYIWEFPNTKPIHYGAQISRMFKQLGNHEIKLTILTSTGKMATTTTIISARTPVVKADFSFSPKQGVAPLEIFFDPAKSTGIIDEYLWDFGDGYTSREFTPTHTYHFPGTYTVNLQITDPNGLVDEMPKKIIIKKK